MRERGSERERVGEGLVRVPVCSRRFEVGVCV